MSGLFAWRPETPDLFSATAYTASDRLHLVVERMPGGGWDWQAWAEQAWVEQAGTEQACAEQGRQEHRRGQEADLAAAMHEAEQAAGQALPLWPATGPSWPQRGLAKSGEPGHVTNAFTVRSGLADE